MMFSDGSHRYIIILIAIVLILVLVDDVLWQKLNQTYQADADVLILVLVDVALLLVITGLGGSC